MTHVVRNIDGLISGIPEAQPISAENSPVNKEPAKSEDVKGTELPLNDVKVQENSSNSSNEPQDDSFIDSRKEVEPPKVAETPEANLDEYGNELPKPKMYSEEEVQRMIRDRLKRGAFRQEAEQPTPQQTQQAQEVGFEYDENSGQTWTQQLERFVENTVQNMGQKQQKQAAEVRERQIQQEFEHKFLDGMGKYPDFVETLTDKPITNDMMKGIRGLQNPAAFLYAVAKKQPGELERIARIPDPYQQSAEMGRLHERMTKAKKSSSAPAPVTQDRGDVNEKSPPKYSIDHLIQEDAAKRYNRR